MFKGKITPRFADHQEVFEAGDAFYVPEGHTALIEEGTEFVQFSPSRELQTVTDVMIRNAQQGAHLEIRYPGVTEPNR